ncbi:hypothetical protein [Nitrosomonas sp. Nm33]|uniref:hypothetical protein n=1 Tax=Nitrosomonas sp. Nm33 TaxID=133724 RepID=UPI0015A1FD24|nr:hypothetical protein [Nitrosomonas sp. Nm33]
MMVLQVSPDNLDDTHGEHQRLDEALKFNGPLATTFKPEKRITQYPASARYCFSSKST